MKVHYLSEPVTQGADIKATLVWYRHYRQGGVVSGRVLSRLALELWSVDEVGQLSQRLDYSVSAIDNVQHIYYSCRRTGRVALVVRGISGEVSEETYALAFTSEQDNRAGDQLAGDFNADGIVDAYDLMQWAKKWMFAPVEGDGEYVCEDINCDGRVDEEDFYLFSRQWHQSSSWYRGDLGQW